MGLADVVKVNILIYIVSNVWKSVLKATFKMKRNKFVYKIFFMFLMKKTQQICLIIALNLELYKTLIKIFKMQL
jgi:hypothetical protein